MCRKQFLCSRSSIERNIYTVIDKENNETVYKEIRAGLMNILKRNNAKEVNILDTYLHEKYGSKWWKSLENNYDSILVLFMSGVNKNYQRNH